MMKKLRLFTCLLLAFSATTQAGTIGFNEKFALATDRTVPLKELIPGTRDYYYYHCLHYQLTGQFSKVDPLLKQWISRHGNTSRVHEIRDRQALLTYDTNNKATLDHIRHRLNLRFTHQKRELDRKPDFPTKLDPKVISWSTLQKREFSRNSNSLPGFEDTALDILVRQQLSPDRRRNLLSRIRRPDHPNLAKIIVDDLNYRHSRGFGSLQIHRQLLKSQLDECLKLKPDLRKNTNFINAYLTKLRPSEDVNWKHDPKIREAYYERLWNFVKTLPPSQNSLKVHTLFHRLAHDRSLGVYDSARFMEYIKLPRNVSYINTTYTSRPEHRHVRANLNANYKSYTLLVSVGTDEPLVRDYLARFLLNAENTRAFDSYFDSNYLKRVFAETKILNGVGDMERWYSMLEPSEYKALKDRIDIDFLPTNKEVISSTDAVNLKVAIKNVKKLIVKVYEINTGNFYRDKKQEITTAIDLDGLVANREKVITYDQVPLRRHVETFAFPKIDKPGVTVIEMIGNGKSSRAVIRKGRLSYAEREGAGGHVFTVFNDRNERVKGASLWMDGHAYKAEDSGEIAIPFSTKPGSQPIVITHNGFSVLEYFKHRDENYRLAAGFYVDREALIAGQAAKITVHPQLLLNDRPVDLSLLEDVVLTITSTDSESISSSKTVKDFKLHNDKESVYEFNTPEKLLKLEFSLTAKVQNVSRRGKDDLAASGTIAVNGINRSAQTQDLHLRQVADGYILEILGKSGELRAMRPVNLTFKHHDFKSTVHAVLMSDKQGRVDLGPLKDIDLVTASMDAHTPRTWPLAQDLHSHRDDIHTLKGKPVMVPFMPEAPEALDTQVSLLESRANTFVRDARDKLRVENGFLVAEGLAAGDYSLYFKRTGDSRMIRVTDGVQQGAHAVSRDRHLELGNLLPLQIMTVTPDKDAIAIRLRNATPDTRVHVTASRYLDDQTLYRQLGGPVTPGLAWRRNGMPLTQYLSERNIGDEYRYIIERKYAKKFPGNMLRRPSLLLNPWSIRQTDTGKDEAEEGEDWEGRPGQSRAYGGRARAAYGGSRAGAGDMSPDLEFMAETALVLGNLKPNKDGIVTVPLKDIGPRQHIEVVALDSENAVYRHIALAPTWTRNRDLRMDGILDPARHFTEQKLVSLAKKEQPFVIKNARASKMEVFDSLQKVYTLYSTLSEDKKLAEFAFILGWPTLTAEKKQELYSKYACHELSFFLYKKDPRFFTSVIVPYLKNKKDKTFLDAWLLGQDLSGYKEPWAYGRLNIVERILLGQAMKAERAAAARHVKDLFDLVPPDIETFNMLFATAIQGSALDAGGAGGGFLAMGGDFGDAADPFAMEDAAEIDIDDVADIAFGAPAPATVGSRSAAAPKPARAAKMLSRKEQNAPMEVERMAEMVLDEKSMGRKRDTARRKQLRQLYQKLDKTEEWVENNYYHLPIANQLADLVTVSGFWKDYAAYDGKGGFQSVNLAEASASFTEMMFALSVLDLPFTSPEHKSAAEGVTVTLTPAGDAVIFHKEITPAKKVPARQPLLISQNFFALNDRYRHENNERFDKFVTEEFLSHRVYGGQVVLTNPTSTQRKVDVLLQIPKGALPVVNGFFTRSFHVVIGPYATRKVEYYFYFPLAGTLAQFPVHVGQDGKLIAFHEPFVFNVVDKLTRIDTTSWEYVSQQGSNDQVFSYLQENNVDRIDLSLIAFRMRDKAFFSKVVGLLRQRHTYNPVLWSYGIYHNDVPVIRDYLPGTRYANQVGMTINSKLLTLNPVARHAYEHNEYRPQGHARTYQLGATRKILNEQFFGHYSRLMKLLTYQPKLTDVDEAAVAYVMFLQDRIEEGLTFFDRVDPQAIPSAMPYDYMKAYAAFYREDPAEAEKIARKYKDHPVDRWRNRFAQVLAQAEEIQGGKVKVVDQEDRDQRQAKLAGTEPSLDFKVENREITIQHQNLRTCQVNYYRVDIELLFSKNPFVQEVTGQFSVIQPNHTETIKLSGSSTTVDLARQFRDSNVMVEIVAGAIRKTQAYYPHSLAIQVMENYGQLRVSQEKGDKPLAKVYVKAYARMKDGSVKFYKDGYTDLRGRFDYSSLSTNELDHVDKFALLIMSEEHGAVVREAAPPKQ